MKTPIETTRKPVNVFWFRRDLRLEDNHGLFLALSENLPVLPVFIFDTEILCNLSNRKDARVHFIHQQLTRIQRDLQKSGRGLVVCQGKPLDVWKDLSARFLIRAVFANHDYEPYAKERDKEIKDFLALQGIEFHTFKDQVIFEKDDILKNDGTPYVVFTPFSRKWRETLQEPDLISFPSEKLIKRMVPLEKTDIMSLQDLGFEKTERTFGPPEIDIELIRKYHLQRDYPGIKGTTGLSTHLRFGTISIRTCVRHALESSQIWLGELIWREFFMMILNHFPYVTSSAFRPRYNGIKWKNESEHFRLWSEGKTGYPLVDAGMRELNQTGLMHNRVRMITASFLVKHLQIDWRWGERYFAEKLLDYDLSANNGNWQWVAGCGCDAAPYFRIFNPIAQQKKFDRDLSYVRQWVPEWNDDSYSKPIVDHREARAETLSIYRSAQIPGA